jgi:hypothetical protein
MFDSSLTCVFCSRGLTEFDFLQEMKLGRRCLCVLIEILSVYPELLTFVTREIKPPGLMSGLDPCRWAEYAWKNKQTQLHHTILGR